MRQAQGHCFRQEFGSYRMGGVPECSHPQGSPKLH
uniref:Uncharacterized protein n=1 Tax=Anguilla anguilla TaxID=7936 RepID=A0A0E9XAQ2_ANGAN